MSPGKSSEEVYSTVTQWLVYAAFVIMVVTLALRISADPQNVFLQLNDAVNGKMDTWRPATPYDYWVLYALYFTNLIVAVGLAASLPSLIKESKAVAVVAIILIFIILLAAHRL